MLQLPLSRLEQHGASIQESAEGFSIITAGGSQFGVFKLPPDPIAFQVERATEAPLTARVAQQAIGTFLEYDAADRKLKADPRFSAFGRTEQLAPLKEKSVRAVAHLVKDFAAHKASVELQELERYGTPQLAPNDFVAALRDHEIRTAVRAMTETERSALLRTLAAGQDRNLTAAILRSPIKFGELEELVARSWREVVDRDDPDGRAVLDVAKASVEWTESLLGIFHHHILRAVDLPPAKVYAVAKEFGVRESMGFTAVDALMYDRGEAIERSRAA